MIELIGLVNLVPYLILNAKNVVMIQLIRPVGQLYTNLAVLVAVMDIIVKGEHASLVQR